MMALVDDDKKLINLPRLSTYDNLIKARLNNCIKNVVYYEVTGDESEDITVPGSEINDTVTSAGYTWSSNKITEELASKADSTHSHTAQEVGALPEDGLLKYFPTGEYPNLVVPVPSEGEVAYPNISLSFSNDDQTLRLRVEESENNYFQLRLTDDFNTSFFDVVTDGVVDSQPIRCLPLNGSLPMRAPIKFKTNDNYTGSGAVYKNHSATEDYGTVIKDFESDDVNVSLTVSAKDNTIKFTAQDGTIYTIYGTHNLSTATSAVQGLVKLYTAIGTSTDGTMTQDAITTALATKSDTNHTHSTGNASTLGLTKLYTSTGTATDGTMTQNAINTELNKKLSLNGGTMTGSAVMKNDTDYTTSRARNIKASTTDLTAGESTLDNGSIYLVYE